MLWTAARAADASPARVLPDGCMDLIFHRGKGLLVAGADRTATLVHGPPGQWYGVRLAPGAGPSVFGPPANELRDRRVPLAGLWPAARVRKLTDRLAELPAAEVIRLLETVVADRLGAAGGPDPLATAVVSRLRTGAPVGAVAAELGIEVRTLHRRCCALFGYGPKTLARILRLLRARALAVAGVPAAEVAVRCGYADQAHLCREVRALAGVPLGALTSGSGTPPEALTSRPDDRGPS
jgi:AraC-like DNA-binding protein